MKGKLIVFEGIDGSGKSTQFDLMCKRLENHGVDFRRLIFPQYNQPSSALIRMYLEGQFGKNPTDVNAYASSAFYAVDRYASFVKVWRDYYLSGGMILADRYTTSNAIHQGAKLPDDEQENFFRWLEQFEYEKMGLPVPDSVVYMDVTLESADENLRSREAKKGQSGDIHETDSGYLAKCLTVAKKAADYYGWNIVKCTSDGAMRNPENIHQEIFTLLFGE